MEKILIVDDVLINREILSDMLADEYEIVQASGGQEAIDILSQDHESFSIVLLDIVMPEIDGFAVISHMKKQQWLDRLPVIVISGEQSNEIEEKALILGAVDFVKKPFEESIVKRRVKNTEELYSYKRSLEDKVIEKTRELIKANHEMEKMNRELIEKNCEVQEQNEMIQKQLDQLRKLSGHIKKNNDRLVEIIGMVVEYRDVESGQHVHRVKGYTEILAREAMKEFPEYGLTEKLIEQISQASVLHDVGKISIPDSVLLKNGKLTKDEFELMKTHSARGAELIDNIKKALENDFAKIAHDICRYHHEKYDGRGYPDGLKGEQIPIAAQLVSIADVYDALISERVYKDAYTPEEAFSMIINGECGMFSPKLMECFRNARGDFEKLKRNGVLSWEI